LFNRANACICAAYSAADTICLQYLNSHSELLAWSS